MAKHLRNGTLLSVVGALLTVSVGCSGSDDDSANKGTGNKTGSGATGGTGAAAGKGGSGGSPSGGTAGKAATGGSAGTTGTGGASGGMPSGGRGGGGAGASGMPASGGMSMVAGAGGMLALAGGAGAPGSGGMPAAGNGAGGMSAAGMSAAGNGAGGAIVGAMAAYHFDTASSMAGAGGAYDGAEGWATNSGACKANVTVSQLTEQHEAGTGSLKIHFEGTPSGAAGAAGTGAAAGAGGAAAGAAGAGGAAAGAGGASAAMNVDCEIRRVAAPLETGKTITYSLHIPPDMGGSLGWINVMVEAGASYTWTTLESVPAEDLAKKDMWVTRQVIVPVSVTPPIQALGLQIGAPSTFTGDIYLDEVSW